MAAGVRLILVDTSVWIEVFRKGAHASLESFLDLEEVVTCLPVIQEVLQGFRDQRAFRIAQEACMRFLSWSPLQGVVFAHSLGARSSSSPRRRTALGSGMNLSHGNDSGWMPPPLDRQPDPRAVRLPAYCPAPKAPDKPPAPSPETGSADVAVARANLVWA